MRWIVAILTLSISSLIFVAASQPAEEEISVKDSIREAAIDYHQSPKLNSVTYDTIEKFFNRFFNAGIFSGTYLFFRNDSLITGNRGQSNFQSHRIFTSDDLFQLASVSKTFTGVAYMKMQEDGILNIDDSVHWHLPDFKRTNLTIRNLLTHSSGLPDYFNLPVPKYISSTEHMYNEDVLKLLNSLPIGNFQKPGSYKYSNTNFVLLALIIERKTGEDFRQYVNDVIFKPAGMLESHICNFDSIPLKNYLVQGYMDGKVYTDLPHNGTTGDKGVYSSVFEMLLYDRALRAGLLLNSTSMKTMYTPQVETDKTGGYYGLGWRMKFIDGRKWVYHNGWWKGFRTYFWRSLEENKMFCVLTNKVQGSFLPTEEMVHLID